MELLGNPVVNSSTPASIEIEQILQRAFPNVNDRLRGMRNIQIEFDPNGYLLVKNIKANSHMFKATVVIDDEQKETFTMGVELDPKHIEVIFKAFKRKKNLRSTLNRISTEISKMIRNGKISNEEGNYLLKVISPFISVSIANGRLITI